MCDTIFKKGPCPWLSSEALWGQGQRALCTGDAPSGPETGEQVGAPGAALTRGTLRTGYALVLLFSDTKDT